MAKNSRYAHILRGTGKQAKKFRFKVFGDNGEPVGGSQNEYYVEKRKAKNTILEYYQYTEDQIIDKTLKLKKNAPKKSVTR